MSLLLLFNQDGAPPPPVVVAATRPTMRTAIAFASNPTVSTQTYTDVSDYLRDVALQRGRNYEYDRIEAGASAFTLSNRDSRFNPENTSSPLFGTLKPTRRVRIQADWDATYDLFHGYTKGYPQEFPGAGFDAIVKQTASDYFYPLNLRRFIPGTTTLSTAITVYPPPGPHTPVPTDVATIQVASTELPMPQVVPFTIRIGEEAMIVDEIVSSTQWLVRRAQDNTNATSHLVGAVVTTPSVSFGEELSGARISNVLTFIGVPTTDMDIGVGVSLIAASDDLAGSNVLAHLQEIAEAENGRLFVSRSGKITFRDRHWVLQNEQTDRATFSDTGGGIRYGLSGPITHDESLIANVIRVTPSSGNTQTATDATSVSENFERVLEKQWPLATDVEAEAAAEWMLLKLKDAQLRIPAVTLDGVQDPDTMWPIILGMEVGQRYAFTYTPKGGGTAITRSVIVEGINHNVTPSTHKVTVQFSTADTTHYARLDVDGYDELDSGNLLAY